MEIVKFDEMKKTWHQIARNNDGSIAPNFELEVYKKMLHVFHPGDFNYYIVNIASVEMDLKTGENLPAIVALHLSNTALEAVSEAETG